MIKGKEIEIVRMNISEIAEYKNNPRKNEEAVEATAKSIEAYGMNDPIIVDENKVILSGHTRLKALKKIGVSVAPVVVVDWLTEKEKAEFRIAHNSTAQIAQWDLTKLQAEIDKFNLDMLGYGLEEQLKEIKKSMAAGRVEEDELAEENKPSALCKPGEIWQLGEHRLMCGDSTDKPSVERLMNGKKVDMVFTDPPYGVSIRGGKGRAESIDGDMSMTVLPFAFAIAVEDVAKDKAHFYFCGGENNILMYEKLFDRYLRIMPKHLIWVKNSFIMKHVGYHNQYEIIFHGYKKGGGGIWYGGRKEEEASDVWKIKRDAVASYLHPTQKPIEIPARAIRNSSPQGGLVYDGFGGSGSTLMACEQLGRICYMMEVDPKYCDVIIRRWEKFTEKQAKKIEG